MARSVAARRLALAALLALAAAVPAMAAVRGAASRDADVTAQQPSLKTLRFGQSEIALSFTPSEFRISEQEIADWVLRSARATATFFGRFPVSKVRITIEGAPGTEIDEGSAWTTPEARIRLVIGRHISLRTLQGDSTMVHEMTHLAFPDLDDAHLWLHEGIATYVETIARAQSHDISPAAAWAHFIKEMPQGLPEKGDKGLDNTASEDRQYWGGAMFCLIADVEIRHRTNNRFGLKDALRGVLAAGGTLASTWSIDRALTTADRAVGLPILSELYTAWKDKPVSPDLEALWAELGIVKARHGIRLADRAPLAGIRSGITELPARPLLLAGPALLYESTQRQ